MKPVTLVMNAFGPFAGRQELDFSLLEDARLFLVTGETGAGKTTIFDAIAFSLYGSASGESRKPGTFKSHHARPGDSCWVELTFSMKGQLYKISRWPPQVSLKRDGTPKEIGEKAEFYLPDGEVVTGIRAVNSRMEEVLGLNYSQFKQTAMLAQGEFRRLIEANSTEKQAIFSKIFATDIYANIASRLAQKETDLHGKVASTRQAIGRVVEELARLGHREMEGEGARFMPYDQMGVLVNRSIESHQTRLTQIQADIDTMEEERRGCDPEAARQLNEKLALFRSLSEVVGEMDAKSPEMAAKREVLTLLEHASSLSQQENVIMASKKAMEELDIRNAAQDKELETLSAALEKARQDQEKAPGLREEAEKHSASLIYLDREWQERVRRREKQNQLDSREKQLENDLIRLKKMKASLALRDIKKRIGQLDETQKLLESLSVSLAEGKTARENLREQTRLREETFRAYLRGQAALLSSNLRDGNPCPVCGSPHHPARAKAADGVPSADKMEKLRSKEDKLSSRIKDIDLRVEINYGKYAVLEQELSLPVTQGNLKQNGPSKALDYIQKLKQSAEERARELALEAGNIPPEPEENIAALSASCEAGKEAVIMLREALADGIGEATGDGDIETQRRELSARIKALTDSATAFDERYRKIAAAAERLGASLRAGKEHYASLSEQFTQQRSMFLERMKNSGFSQYKDYRSRLAEAGQLAVLKKEIAEYDKNYAAARIRLDSLRPDVEGKNPVDVPALERRLAILEERLTGLRNTERELHSWIILSLRGLDELKRLHDEAGDLDKRYTAVKELSVLAKGSKYPNISFERYILASYFEDILQVANIHLQRMTGLRFSLKRKEDASRGTSGLDMEVVDNYTCTRRDVSTLSGGEGFKASLALALGLSDVVQMYAGGVSIDTMFIDEGFGSLDEKSLDSVVETLMSLQNIGRMVGIISHVQSLSNYIPAKITVTRTPIGSSRLEAVHNTRLGLHQN